MDCYANDSVIILDDDSDDAVKVIAKTSSSSKDNSVIFVPDGDYDDEVVFIEPEDYSPKKKLRLDEEKRMAELNSAAQITSDIAVTFDRKGVEFPHAREHCRSYSFQRIPTGSFVPQNASSNEKYCEKCYCFVCDELSSKCEKWKVGAYPHCHSYAKNSYWEKERRRHKLYLNKKEAHYEPILSCINSSRGETDVRSRNFEMCNEVYPRLELVELLINVCKYQEARTVSMWPLKTPLPSDLTLEHPHEIQKSASYSYHSCAILSLKSSTIKTLINGLMHEKNIDLSRKKEQADAKLLEVVAFVLPSLFSKNTSMELFNFYFDKFFSDGVFKIFTYRSLEVAKAIQKCVSNLIRKKLNPGKLVEVHDLKCKECPVVPEIFVLEVFATSAAKRFSVKDVMSSLHQKKLEWVCVSLLVNPDLQDRIFAQEIKFFYDNILSKTGSSLIPLEIMEKWYSKINGSLYFNILFELAGKILEEGHRLTGKVGTCQEGLVIKRKAVKLSQKLSSSVFVNSIGRKQKSVQQLLKKINDKFASEAAFLGMKYVAPSLDLEMKFLSEPSFESLQNIRKSISDEETWLRKLKVLLQFLDKNSSKYQEVTIEIYSRLEMFDKLKSFLSKRQDVNCLNNMNMIQTLLKPGSSVRESKLGAFVDAAHGYIAYCLVFSCFDPWCFKKVATPMNDIVIDTVKMLHSVSPSTFKSLMKNAFHLIKELFLNNTVSPSKRAELREWLMKIKEIYNALAETKEWNHQFNAFLRDFKRKNQIVQYLKNRVPPS